ncbi:MAG TPA: hypothetical protein VIK01_15315 [Polyangiaceae bacterium]
MNPRFEFASAFENGLARVEHASGPAGPAEAGYIDHGGRFVWGPVADAP